MCIGLSTAACSRGLYEQKTVEFLDPADRTVQKGIGGPTGCTEAWATLVTNDDQIPGIIWGSIAIFLVNYLYFVGGG